MTYSLGELAERLEGRVTAEPEREVSGLATLREAGPRDLSFLTHPRYLEAARATRAGAVLVGSDPPELARPLLVVEEPYAALARLLTLFYPEEPTTPDVHPTAAVAPDAELEEGVSIGPFVVVGAQTRVGQGAILGAGTVIGKECDLGSGCRLYPRVVLYDRTVVGARSILHAGCVIGSDGFGFATSSTGEHQKLRHVGRVVIKEDVEIGANTTVDRGLLAETRIGAGSKIDNLVQVAHNVEIGSGSLLAAQSGIAGSSRLGKGVMMGGQSGVSGHLELADGVQVAAKSAVLQSVEDTGPVAGIPAVAASRWRRQQAWVRRLEELGGRVRRLERVRGEDEEGDEREHS